MASNSNIMSGSFAKVSLTMFIIHNGKKVQEKPYKNNAVKNKHILNHHKNECAYRSRAK